MNTNYTTETAAPLALRVSFAAEYCRSAAVESLWLQGASLPSTTSPGLSANSGATGALPVFGHVVAMDAVRIRDAKQAAPPRGFLH